MIKFSEKVTYKIVELAVHMPMSQTTCVHLTTRPSMGIGWGIELASGTKMCSLMPDLQLHFYHLWLLFQAAWLKSTRQPSGCMVYLKVPSWAPSLSSLLITNPSFSPPPCSPPKPNLPYTLPITSLLSLPLCTTTLYPSYPPLTHPFPLNTKPSFHLPLPYPVIYLPTLPHISLPLSTMTLYPPYTSPPNLFLPPTFTLFYPNTIPTLSPCISLDCISNVTGNACWWLGIQNSLPWKF